MTGCVCLLQGFISGARLIAYHAPSFLRILAFWTQNNIGSKGNYCSAILTEENVFHCVSGDLFPSDGQSSKGYLISLSLDFDICMSGWLGQSSSFWVLFSEVLSFLESIFGATLRARRRLRWLLVFKTSVLLLSYMIGTLHMGKKFNAKEEFIIIQTYKFCKAPYNCAVLSCSVVSDSLRPYGLQSARLLCPWDSPGKKTGVGCHALFQGIFPTQGSNPGLLHCRWILYCLNHQGSPPYHASSKLEDLSHFDFGGSW